MRELSSFDLFDTLLIRRVCDPKAVFYFAGRESARQGLTGLTAERFAKARAEAESLARIGEPDAEVNLDDIYKVFHRMAGCTESQLQDLKQVELDWERRMITPVPGAREMVGAARQGGRPVHFLSEMYLPEEFLETLLRGFTLMRDGDGLWVSNAHKASKRSGRLFSVFLEKARLNHNEVRHYGNDWHADVDAAGRAGIPAIHLPQANATQQEVLLERYCSETGGWASLMAGAGRMVRLQSVNDARIAGLRRITANVACPSLTCYVLWILQNARSLGLHRLYFISRDGFIPYLLAKHLAATLLPDLECRYLYGSRQAWHLAGIRELDDFALDWILRHLDGMTCASLLKRIGLSWDQFRELAPEVVAIMGDDESSVSSGARDALKSALQARGALFDALMAEAGRRRALLRDYAAQEGLLDGVPLGMVEIGWFGRTRISLEKALGENDARNLNWFYLALDQEARLHDSQRVNYFLSGPELRRKEIPFLHEVVECFCLAPHGSVAGFHRELEKIVPIFHEGIEIQLDDWGRGQVLTAVEEYIKHLPVEYGEFPDAGTFGGAAYELLREFCTNPSVEDARLWGGIPFQQDQATGKASPLAPNARVNAATIKGALIFGSVERACMAGSVAAWGAGSWFARRKPLYILTLAARAGYLRIHWKSLLRKAASRLLCVLPFKMKSFEK